MVSRETLDCRPKALDRGPKLGPKAVEPLLELPEPPNDMLPRSGAATVVSTLKYENEGSWIVEACWAMTGPASHMMHAAASPKIRFVMVDASFPKALSGCFLDRARPTHSATACPCRGHSNSRTGSRSSSTYIGRPLLSGIVTDGSIPKWR